MGATAEIGRLRGASDSGFCIEELLSAAVFPHEVARLQLRETHISWVILTGPFAYKVKKGIKLDFCDATTLARRRSLCEEEIRLNRRLAADLYTDVVPITRDPSGLRIGGTGPTVEYAVRMKQFDASEEMHALLSRFEISIAEVTRLADRLAKFHTEVPRAPGPDAFDYVERLRGTVLGNIAILLAHLDSISQFPEMSRLIDWTHDTLHQRAAELRERHARGFIRECHGDLHARNIVRWQGELTPFDCLEFDPRLRQVDVMNDIAFLVMDLAAHGRRDLAGAFLSRYAERTGDYRGIRLLPLYAVDRALVRAMVDALAAEQRADRHDELYGKLHGRIRTAVAFTHLATPALYIMHGPSGSGKSWLSERLVPLLGAVRVRSDLERKRLAGLEAHSRAPEELYSAEWSNRTYTHLAACAESCLSAGLDTVVDAAFLAEAERRMFQDLAHRLQVRF